jgi:hypothetical protein
MMMNEEYKVGDKLWWISSDNNRTQREVTVEKVGRVWLTLSNRHRVDKTTLVADAGAWVSPGTCWLSKEAYEHCARLRRAWTVLRCEVSNRGNIPNDVTLEDIKAAAMYLKLEIKI